MTEVLQDQLSRLRELHAERRIDDIARGHSKMEITRVWAGRLSNIGQKSNDIMLCLSLDLVNSLHVESGFLADFIRGSRGNDAKFLLLRSSKEFYFKPNFVAVLICPNSAHFSACVARDHAKLVKKSAKARLTLSSAA